MQSTASWIRPALAVVFAVGCAGASLADIVPVPGKGVITANLHRLAQSTTCPDPDVLPEGVASDPNIDVVSYHTFGSNRAVPRCVVETAMNRTHYGKPKIVSSDGGAWTNADAWCWINTILAQAPPATCPPLTQPLPTHAEHYEHYEAFFDRMNCENLARECVTSVASCDPFSFPMEDEPVGGVGTFPQCTGNGSDTRRSSDEVRTKLGNKASVTRPNGRIFRSGRELCWGWNRNATTCASPMRLMGYSWMGALTGSNFDLDAYLSAIKDFGSNGANLTRVWAIEQWTGGGFTPFLGTTNAFDLDAPNPAFYARLQAFAQKAADRGIAVQFTLFDKHGLKGSGGEVWGGSPYNAANNSQGYLPSALVGGRPRPEFLYWDELEPPIGEVHRRFIREVAREVGGNGNVMFEIFNEPRVWTGNQGHNGDFLQADLEAFQSAVAAELRAQLPIETVRDAFNDEAAYPVVLNGKSSDTGDVWWASNARVVQNSGAGERYTRGRVVSQETAGVNIMNAALSFPSGARSVSVRARLTRTAGTVMVGLRNAGGSIAAHFNGTSFLIRHAVGSTVTTLATAPADSPSSAHVRLELDTETDVAALYVDSKLTMKVLVPGGIPDYDQGQMSGWVSAGTTYLSSHGSVDDFEIDTYSN